MGKRNLKADSTTNRVASDLRAGYQPEPRPYGYKRLFQILEQFSFGANSSFEVFREPASLDFEDMPAEMIKTLPATKYFAGVVRWSFPYATSDEQRQVYTADLDAIFIENVLQRFTTIPFPLWIDVNGGGLDGTMYEMQFGDSFMYQLNIQWWSDYPPQWEPFFEIVRDVINHIEQKANIPLDRTGW